MCPLDIQVKWAIVEFGRRLRATSCPGSFHRLLFPLICLAAAQASNF
jgi:hypothetical protein